MWELRVAGVDDAASRSYTSRESRRPRGATGLFPRHRRPILRFVVGRAALLLALLPAAPAHGTAVSGAFVEKGTNTPLAGVAVVLRRAADSTVVARAATGGDGRFRLDSLRFDHYLLRATLLGHGPYVRRDVVLTEREPDLDLGTIALAVTPIAIPGVDITSERATAIVAPDRNIYLTKDLPGATAGTAADVLRAVPELDVDLDGHVSLRGSASVNLQFNGRAAPMKGDALATFLRQMPASRIERVEVIANPSAKYDPEGTAGIVNLVLKDDLGLGLSGNLYLTTGNSWNGPGARVAWQEGKLTLFGGLSGSLGSGRYFNDSVRQDLAPSAAGSFGSAAASHYRTGFAMLDASFDYVPAKRFTLYGTANGYRNSSDTDALTHVVATDSTLAAVSRYDRTGDGSSEGQTSSFTLGIQHVVRAGRDERTLELLASDSHNGSDGRSLQTTQVPAGVGDQVSRQGSSSGDHERSLEADDTHPLGARGKLELGYRGLVRRNTSSGTLRYFAADTLVVTPLSDASDYVHREVFQSGYVTLGSTFGRLSLQLGARAEAAHTTFDVRSTGQSYAHDYRSVFPSANVAWDLGRGRSLRLTYSKRIERPSPSLLNPDVPTPDSLNRFVGNPALGPKYTHSFSLDASWTGSRGLLRLSPYYRETIDNWDQITRVDAGGAATTTWQNASSIRYYGLTLAASLRQTGRLGGTLSTSVYREHHDASNVSSQFQGEATNWSAGGNATFKTTRVLDLQGYLRFSPAQTLAQGRSSAFTYLTLGARWKLNEAASASLWVRDPFNLAHFSRSTGDATYTQTTTSHNTLRGISGTLTWTWGKPPEQKPRRQAAEPQPTDEQNPGR